MPHGGNEDNNAPAKSGGVPVPKVPGTMWCESENKPATRECGASNHKIKLEE